MKRGCRTRSLLDPQLARKREAQESKLEAVRNFAYDAKLPKPLRKALFAFFRGQPFTDYDTRHVLAELPFDLRSSTLLHLYGDLIESIPLFQGAPAAFVSEVCSNITVIFYTKGSIVCQKGELGTCMYIVSDGELEIEGVPGVVLTSGMYFGEGSILTGQRRTATIKAKSNCQLCTIGRDGLKPLLKAYPEQRQKLQDLFDSRTKKPPPKTDSGTLTLSPTSPPADSAPKNPLVPPLSMSHIQSDGPSAIAAVPANPVEVSAEHSTAMQPQDEAESEDDNSSIAPTPSSAQAQHVLASNDTPQIDRSSGFQEANNQNQFSLILRELERLRLGQRRSRQTMDEVVDRLGLLEDQVTGLAIDLRQSGSSGAAAPPPVPSSGSGSVRINVKGKTGIANAMTWGSASENGDLVTPTLPPVKRKKAADPPPKPLPADTIVGSGGTISERLTQNNTRHSSNSSHVLPGELFSDLIGQTESTTM